MELAHFSLCACCEFLVWSRVFVFAGLFSDGSCVDGHDSPFNDTQQDANDKEGFIQPNW